MRIHVCDILNWEYLAEIGCEFDPTIIHNDCEKIIATFAYVITKTADEEKRDQILSDLLQNSCFGTRPSKNEEFLAWIAKQTKSDLDGLRKFARQCGIKLKRKW